MRESAFHVGTKLTATAAQRVMGMSGSRGHDDAASQVSEVQQKVMRGQKGNNRKVSEMFPGPSRRLEKSGRLTFVP